MIKKGDFLPGVITAGSNSTRLFSVSIGNSDPLENVTSLYPLDNYVQGQDVILTFLHDGQDSPRIISPGFRSRSATALVCNMEPPVVVAEVWPHMLRDELNNQCIPFNFAEWASGNNTRTWDYDFGIKSIRDLVIGKTEAEEDIIFVVSFNYTVFPNQEYHIHAFSNTGSLLWTVDSKTTYNEVRATQLRVVDNTVMFYSLCDFVSPKFIVASYDFDGNELTYDVYSLDGTQHWNYLNISRDGAILFEEWGNPLLNDYCSLKWSYNNHVMAYDYSWYARGLLQSAVMMNSYLYPTSQMIVEGVLGSGTVLQVDNNYGIIRSFDTSEYSIGSTKIIGKMFETSNRLYFQGQKDIGGIPTQFLIISDDNLSLVNTHELLTGESSSYFFACSKIGEENGLLYFNGSSGKVKFATDTATSEWGNIDGNSNFIYSSSENKVFSIEIEYIEDPENPGEFLQRTHFFVNTPTLQERTKYIDGTLDFIHYGYGNDGFYMVWSDWDGVKRLSKL